MSGRDLGRRKIVGCTRDLVEHGVARPARQGLAVRRIEAVMSAAGGAYERRRRRHYLAFAVGADRHCVWRKHHAGHRLPVEDYFAAAQLDRVSGEPDYPFYEIGVFGRMAEHDDVAALRKMLQDAAAERRKAERQAVAR